MKAFVGCSVLVFALTCPEQAPASSPADVIVPNENLVADGIPPIPASLAEEVRRYSEFRSASLADWHPTRREMLIVTRFAEAPQMHRVAAPGGARTQLTFFPDRVGGAWTASRR